MKKNIYLPDPEIKDIQRVEKMVAMSEDCGIVDSYALQRQCLTMAAKITKPDKALRRASALLQMTGVDKGKLRAAANIFIDRANQL
jgi:hypothetical protein